MPQLIKYIDKIAREKGHSVIFVSFNPEEKQRTFIGHPEFSAPYHYYDDYENDGNRKELIKWLDENNIAWQPCAGFASEDGWVAYNGNIYIDVPWDETNSQYITVQTKLENYDGTPRNPAVIVWGVTLLRANANAHHDAPGFWEKWAETF